MLNFFRFSKSHMEERSHTMIPTLLDQLAVRRDWKSHRVEAEEQSTYHSSGESGDGTEQDVFRNPTSSSQRFVQGTSAQTHKGLISEPCQRRLGRK